MDYERARNFIGPFEGSVSHMYLDTEGLVTVGIGNMLPTADAACALAFVHRDSQAPASRADIAADFDRVRAQPKAMRASAYLASTALDLPPAEIDRLFRRRVDEFLLQLNGLYPQFETYPASAQLAMLDMAFNLGAPALKKRWPKLNDAIDRGDWPAAATECTRPGAQPSRNAGTIALFQAAATEA